MRQVRAEGTRNALLLAAAQIFDRDGYEGTTLATISDRAAVSKGALSFHFSSKSALADAVQYLSCERSRSELEALDDPGAPALRALGDMVDRLVHRLATDPLTRAGLRLARERGRAPGRSPDCRLVWRAALRRAVLRAHDDNSLRPGAEPESVADLALALALHQEAVGADRDQDAWLSGVWELVLPALVPPTVPDSRAPTGSCP
ncbi:TetR/AcrR family transcriptional regulator [Streptomyces sp. 5-8]|uniref:TetR/AcrR family transcriptional regulator n=1 Tax=Streptomyces musisoli TaxID=2802280 RepID=A0ABS1NTS2_9ACTN|nr:MULTISPECIES: TetR/AcrR family transcriptional regulator [Streptomyces]MBL1103505.1 TetR/AcrR family transcriptional regulator [Streptomyces musisoli]MBY8839890.1 TetR/AcrR family transcriptional regulator [Streptomyces sp. SP2-10]